MDVQAQRGKTQCQRRAFPPGVASQPVQRLADDRVLAVILERDERQGGRLGVRPQLLAVDDGVAVVPAAVATGAIQQETIANGDSLLDSGVSLAPPAELLQEEDAPR